MSLFTRVSALLFVSLVAAIPFAGCSSGASSNCSHYCKSTLACATAQSCTFVDPGAAEDACVSLCEAGFNGLTGAETQAIDDCLSCAIQANPNDQCISNLPKTTCETICGTKATTDALDKWLQNLGSAPPPPGGECTNGRDYFSTQSECDFGGDGMSCSIQCCNGKCGATPDVGVTCDETTSPGTCTCTNGKNKGKTFTPAGDPCDANEAWNQCNL
jgi:hypothetical protein